MKRAKITENVKRREKLALEDYKNGVKISHVLLKYNLSWCRLMSVFKANGIQYTPRRQKQRKDVGVIRKQKIDEFDARIINEYEQGYTINELAAKYKLGINETANILRKMLKRIRDEDKEELNKDKVLCHYCEVNIWKTCNKRGADVYKCKSFKPDHRYNEEIKSKLTNNKKEKYNEQ